LGALTEQQIPTLEEALLTSKNKILVNLDKSYKIFDKCYDVIKSTGTINQVIIKGGKTRQEVEQEFGDYIDKVIFMPVIWSSNKSDMVVQDYLENRKPIAFEFIIPEDTINLGPYFKKIRDKGSSVWVNSLWPRLSGGHSDDRALIDINIYQWYIDNHVDIIQTDRPELLLEFLRSKGLHQ
jgi:glycerophosphoryl diester phosphodiesterase